MALAVGKVHPLRTDTKAKTLHHSTSVLVNDDSADAANADAIVTDPETPSSTPSTQTTDSSETGSDAATITPSPTPEATSTPTTTDEAETVLASAPSPTPVVLKPRIWHEECCYQPTLRTTDLGFQTCDKCEFGKRFDKHHPDCSVSKYVCRRPDDDVRAAMELGYESVEALNKEIEDAESEEKAADEAVATLKEAENVALSEAEAAAADTSTDSDTQNSLDAALDASTDEREDAEEFLAELTHDLAALRHSRAAAETPLCPNVQLRHGTDPGKHIWTDMSDAVFKALPSRIGNDNAGSWTSSSASWNMRTTMIPGQEELQGAIYPLGDNVLTVTSVDAYGNENSCKFNVWVVDEEPPVLVCPVDMILGTDMGQCSVAVEWDDPVATDNVAGIEVISSMSSPQQLSPGMASIDFHATDAAGNTETCTFSVEVQDQEEPELMCPSSELRHIANTQCTDTSKLPSVDVAINCVVDDNCGGVAEQDIECEPKSPYSLGAHSVVCSAKDAFGNLAKRHVMVHVLDKSPPVITCPEDRTVEATGSTVSVELEEATATDNSCRIISECVTPDAGIYMRPGLHVIEWEAADQAGHTARCSYTITVEDTTAPVWADCPTGGEIKHNTINGEDYAIATWTMPTATDPAGGVVEYGENYTKFISGLAYPLGATHIIYVATNALGNEAVCEFDITVIDHEKPRFELGTLNSKVCPQTPSNACQASKERCVATGDVCGGLFVKAGVHDSMRHVNSNVTVTSIGTDLVCCIDGDTCEQHPDSEHFKICLAAAKYSYRGRLS